MLQRQEEIQHVAAEWCEHDPEVLIHRKGDLSIETTITYEGAATQATIDALPAPAGAHLNADGNLVMVVKAPGFPWAFKVRTVVGPHRRFRQVTRYGDQRSPLDGARDVRIVVDLP